MFVKKELTFDEMSDFLWGPALELWLKASDEQRQAVWDMLEDTFHNEIPDETTVNDIVWHDCDEYFFPDEEEYDESLKRNKVKQNKLEARIKKLEKILLRK